jgi:hypothetical protein
LVDAQVASRELLELVFRQELQRVVEHVEHVFVTEAADSIAQLAAVQESFARGRGIATSRRHPLFAFPVA